MEAPRHPESHLDPPCSIGRVFYRYVLMLVTQKLPLRRTQNRMVLTQLNFVPFFTYEPNRSLFPTLRLEFDV
jgi:hypothetical protein